jgi:hypothetical protein
MPPPDLTRSKSSLDVPPMRTYLVPATAALLVLGLQSGAAEPKLVQYAAVKVNVSEAYRPDDAFKKLQAAFGKATADKDAAALFALVGPTFVWTADGSVSDRFDLGRDATHNFKVLFGFRAPGKDADSGVDDGPYWDTLAEFAADGTYYKAADNLVCGPTAAEIADEDAFERARRKIDPDDSGLDWYFTSTEVAVTNKPDDRGAPVAKLSGIAVPLVSVYPAPTDKEPVRPATHVQILLPTGQTGWIPAAAARPLFSDRLCYAKTVSGEWTIVAFDQSGG